MGIQERRQREREARRRAVLDAARHLVKEHGYQGMTTKQIAAECELSEATVFWYFRSKDEIFTSLLFEAMAFMQAELEGPATNGPIEPAEVVRGLWQVFVRLRAEFPEYFQVFTSLANPDATAAVSEEVKRELVEQSGENFRLAARGLEPALGSERARATVDAAWALFVGLGVLRDSRANLGARAGPDPDLEFVVELLLPHNPEPS